MLSNGNSFSGGHSDTSAYPETWVYRIMQPVQDRGSDLGRVSRN